MTVILWINIRLWKCLRENPPSQWCWKQAVWKVTLSTGLLVTRARWLSGSKGWVCQRNSVRCCSVALIKLINILHVSPAASDCAASGPASCWHDMKCRHSLRSAQHIKDECLHCVWTQIPCSSLREHSWRFLCGAVGLLEGWVLSVLGRM